MPRARRNDPAGVRDDPVVVADHERLRTSTAEFLARFDYIMSSYRFWQVCMGNDADFNRSLDRLRRALKRERLSRRRLCRLHPEIEALVTHYAEEAARLRTGLPDAEPDKADALVAAKRAVATIKPRRGRPEGAVLRHHVEGLMALVQETSGKPVLAGKSRGSIYDPYLCEGVSQIISAAFREDAAGITNAKLARIVLDARREYGGKPMHFRDYFPFFGAMIDSEAAVLQLVPGMALEKACTNTPIYCP